MMKTKLRILFALVLSAAALVYGVVFYNSTITPFDRPFFLSSIRETIIATKDSDHLGEDFFVENKYVKLTGKFYIDRGIPEEFKLGYIEDKPDHARVFKVEKLEAVTNNAVH